MQIEILERKENPLLDREEITFNLTYENASTPSRESVAAKLAALVNADKERTIISMIKGHFGQHQSSGKAHVYPTVELAKKVELDHIMVRNGHSKGDTKK